MKNLKHEKIAFKKANILILGMSYKKNIDDFRESASIRLIDKLLKKGIKNISVHDPYVDQAEFKKIKKIYSLSSKILQSFDIVVLMTDHDLFDYDMLKKNSKLIIDCRGRFEAKENVQRG